jgi:hypothetical protein
LILKKIDQELVKSNSEQLIQNALATIGDFFNIGGGERNLVSPIAVEIYLKEKNLFGQLLKMRKGISDPAKKKYTIDAVVRSIYAEDVTSAKEETALEINEENLGELAEKHAENLDKAEVEDFIDLEEEEALLALYEEELKEVPSPEDPDVAKSGDEKKAAEEENSVDVEKTVEEENSFEEEREEIVEQAEEPDLKSSDKEIVDEMMQDYFNEEGSKTEGEEGVSEEAFQEKKVSTVEDEMLEVFERLDEEDTTEQKTEAVPEESEVVKDTVEKSDVKEKSFETEEQIEIEEENSLTQEDSRVNEIEETTTEKEVKTSFDENVEEEESDERFEENVVRKKDLFSYLSRKETKKILSHIFLKDEEDFTNTVEKIMECESYKEASDILRSVFNSYKVSPYAKDAVNFTNAVSNYFRQA